jgi:hypothetical protein
MGTNGIWFESPAQKRCWSAIDRTKHRAEYHRPWASTNFYQRATGLNTKRSCACWDHRSFALDQARELAATARHINDLTIETQLWEGHFPARIWLHDIALREELKQFCDDFRENQRGFAIERAMTGAIGGNASTPLINRIPFVDDWRSPATRPRTRNKPPTAPPARFRSPR